MLQHAVNDIVTGEEGTQLGPERVLKRGVVCNAVVEEKLAWKALSERHHLLLHSLDAGWQRLLQQLAVRPALVCADGDVDGELVASGSLVHLSAREVQHIALLHCAFVDGFADGAVVEIWAV